ncbi:MAG: calcium-binding protein [Actinomycetota bacterium]
MPTPIRAGATLVVAAVHLAASVIAPPGPAAAPRCFGKKATIVGTGGRDRIKGTPRADVIVALGGGDAINGKAGDDLICGGGGNDTIRGKKGDDRTNGGPGGDIMFGHAGDDDLIGKGGSDELIAGPGNDRMRGGQGFDILEGGAGDDIYDGGGSAFDLAGFEHSPVGVAVDLNEVTPQVTNEGTDTILAIEGLFGSAFNDVLTGQNVPSVTGNGLFGFLGADQLSGLDGDDVVDGAPGNDILNGGAGNDLIFGDIGDDQLYGEAGDDLLDGFDGADFGSGGPGLDQCLNIETFDAPPPEDLPPGDTCQPAVPRGALDRLERWTSVRARWEALVPAR